MIGLFYFIFDLNANLHQWILSINTQWLNCSELKWNKTHFAIAPFQPLQMLRYGQSWTLSVGISRYDLNDIITFDVLTHVINNTKTFALQITHICYAEPDEFIIKQINEGMKDECSKVLFKVSAELVNMST